MSELPTPPSSDENTAGARRSQNAASSPSPLEMLAAATGATAEEGVWLDVIHKMDEVYNDLLQYEVALEQKNAALEDSQQFISSVLTSMSDLLIVCNRAGNIESVNPALASLLGLEAPSLHGRVIFDLFADEASRRYAGQMFSEMSGETLEDCEMQLKSANGTAIPVSLNCTPRYSGVGKMLGVVITGRPVGELRRAYQALRRAHEDLKNAQQQLIHSEKMASLGRLVAGVAHELNNPISFVFGNAVAMKRYAERFGRYLDAVHRNVPMEEREVLRAELRIDRMLADLPSLIDGTVEGAERTRDIVDALKRFSVTDRDERQRFDLAPVIDRAVNWVCKAASDKFEVRLNLVPGLEVDGSPGQLQQVIMNLVQNAVDATSAQLGSSGAMGVLGVTGVTGGAGTSLPRLEINGEIGGEIGEQAISVSFRDNGPGIPAEHLDKLFDPFFTTKPVGKGTGLGLAISYGIVERHGGMLSAANYPKGGAVFTLKLPLAPSGKKTDLPAVSAQPT